jgi:hypothetical protein
MLGTGGVDCCESATLKTNVDSNVLIRNLGRK